MKVFALTTLTLLGLVAAQDLSTLPACATSCALNGIGATGCEVTDSTCICSNQSFLSDVQSCISAPGACNEADIQATLAFASTFCGGTPSTNGTDTSSSTSGTENPSTSTVSETSESTVSPEASATETSSAEESSASETGSSASESATAAAETSGSFAAPTLAAFGVAQLLGVAGVVVAAL